MESLSNFAAKLERDFGGRLRIRWSKQAEEWQIEERVGRAILPPVFISDYSDDQIRARDGYSLVLSLRPGDRMPCPKCGMTLKVPIREVAEVRCPICSTESQATLVKAAFWPLGDSLLEYLRKIDPLRDGPRRMAEEADAINRRRAAAQERALGNEVEAATKDMLPLIGGWTQVGYTGREQYQH